MIITPLRRTLHLLCSNARPGFFYYFFLFNFFFDTGCHCLETMRDNFILHPCAPESEGFEEPIVEDHISSGRFWSFRLFLGVYIFLTNSYCLFVVQGEERDLRLNEASFERAAALLRRVPEFTVAAALRQEEANSGTIVAFSHGNNR